MRFLLGIYRTCWWGRHVTGIYYLYNMYIPCIYWSGSDIPVIYQEYSLYILHGLFLVYTLYIPNISSVYTKYILSISSVYTMNMFGIYIVYFLGYTMYMFGIYIVYTSVIPNSYLIRHHHYSFIHFVRRQVFFFGVGQGWTGTMGFAGSVISPLAVSSDLVPASAMGTQRLE